LDGVLFGLLVPSVFVQTGRAAFFQLRTAVALGGAYAGDEK